MKLVSYERYWPHLPGKVQIFFIFSTILTSGPFAPISENLFRFLYAILNELFARKGHPKNKIFSDKKEVVIEKNFRPIFGHQKKCRELLMTKRIDQKFLATKKNSRVFSDPKKKRSKIWWWTKKMSNIFDQKKKKVDNFWGPSKEPLFSILINQMKLFFK